VGFDHVEVALHFGALSLRPGDPLDRTRQILAVDEIAIDLSA
jgi:hypothetical protein